MDKLKWYDYVVVGIHADEYCNNYTSACFIMVSIRKHQEDQL